jgi:hypothetical protein
MTSREAASTKAAKWLQEEGFVWNEVNQPGFSHFYIAHNQSTPTNKVTVSQLADDEKLIVALGVSLDEALQKLIRNMPTEKQLEMKKGLLKLLYRSPNSFKVNEEGGLKSVSLFQPIYPDGQTKDRFMSVINDLHKTQALILLWLDDNIPATVQRRGARRLAPASRNQATHGPGQRACPSCGATVRQESKYCPTCGSKLD